MVSSMRLPMVPSIRRASQGVFVFGFWFTSFPRGG
jgi:hypothetical protein